jgi:hypothetical protein
MIHSSSWNTYLENALRDILKQPTGKDVILNPEMDDSVLDTIYEQLANYLLQLLEYTFGAISAISKAPASKIWSVTGEGFRHINLDWDKKRDFRLRRSFLYPFNLAWNALTDVLNHRAIRSELIFHRIVTMSC